MNKTLLSIINQTSMLEAWKQSNGLNQIQETVHDPSINIHHNYFMQYSPCEKFISH